MGSAEKAALLERPLAQLQQCAARAEVLLQQQSQQERAQIDCGPGCGSCCVVNVSTLVPEGIAICRYLRRYSKDEQAEVLQQIDNLWKEVRGLDDEERLIARRSCAFLNSAGSCRIYPVRPLLCRSITSTDADSCREALAGAVFGDEKAVLMYQYQQQLYEAMFTELGEQLESAGLDGRSFPLSGFVRYLLQHPAAETELLQGRRLQWQELY